MIKLVSTKSVFQFGTYLFDFPFEKSCLFLANNVSSIGFVDQLPPTRRSCCLQNMELDCGRNGEQIVVGLHVTCFQKKITLCHQYIVNTESTTLAAGKSYKKMSVHHMIIMA